MNNNSVSQEVDVRTFSIDNAHSQVGFTVRHMGFSKVRGRFEQFEGTIHLDPDNLETLETEAVVRTDSVTTADEKRDTHLRTSDFFMVDEHPEMTFRSSDVRDVSGSSFTLVGDLTLRGVTKTVELKGKFLGSGTDPWGGTRIAFEASTKINRKEFGLNWNTVLETGGFLVSDEVEITLEVQAAEQQDS
jgi:polyisoprenoid-binding protein YceI